MGSFRVIFRSFLLPVLLNVHLLSFFSQACSPSLPTCPFSALLVSSVFFPPTDFLVPVASASSSACLSLPPSLLFALPRPARPCREEALVAAPKAKSKAKAKSTPGARPAPKSKSKAAPKSGAIRGKAASAKAASASSKSGKKGKLAAAAAAKPKRAPKPKKIAFKKIMWMSEPLARFMGTAQDALMNTRDPAKRIFDYVTERNLIDPNKKGEFVCDETLAAIFPKTRRMRHFLGTIEKALKSSRACQYWMVEKLPPMPAVPAHLPPHPGHMHGGGFPGAPMAPMHGVPH
uniref:DM2 domain-containing protein n=1 Tax=Chromera velia CCMP2878 TaxID=1169474 RepID=A0A0G4HXZ3_9ALVE|eukprot:Cvel_9383.t1-p1 / transcript=Cvel_9383.t1 / gene=Cvel_9383 / organism=Chromera_velia_CCMP2878 / gene_product=hypothetical protein / transcript_product=hypothetical protein / location=Cvel_scaffold539:14530-16199(+) / protein_length=289 / sequence_SO=supercontig / SO=protein_coding / is_pseudo=false